MNKNVWLNKLHNSMRAVILLLKIDQNERCMYITFPGARSYQDKPSFNLHII